ncbi:Uncharacterized protein HZ326_10384 [Fusarium oxysporum f. sp. albedinis]|nr:Uncharacterized protein HZ326_10384 [Fusarium oxysporum f. sp. albedinis]
MTNEYMYTRLKKDCQARALNVTQQLRRLLYYPSVNSSTYNYSLIPRPSLLQSFLGSLWMPLHKPRWLSEWENMGYWRNMGCEKLHRWCGGMATGWALRHTYRSILILCEPDYYMVSTWVAFTFTSRMDAP